ncbi:MAG: helix-turn-helix transcriptional regulator [Clostridiales bacterium]|nr:helix-turn-helix transcriptional regulator [Clostridiales bacterium]
MNLEYDLTEVTVLDSFSFTSGTEKCFPYMADVGGRYYCGKSYYTKREFFSQSLFLYTCKGQGEITYRGKTINLLPGMMILLDGKYSHQYKTAKEDGWEFFWFHYNDCSPYSFADCFWEKNLQVQRAPVEEVEHFFAELKELSKKHVMFSNMQNSQLLSEFFCKWAVHNMKRQNSELTQKEEIANKARKYIQENFEAEVTVEKLSNICAVSKYYFIRIFADVVGMTPHQYLLSMRIGHAKLLLLSTSDTIREIGEKVGFDNASSFIAAFKKIVGVTPLVFRNTGEKTSGGIL